MAKLDKPIIHFQLPHDEKGVPTVDMYGVVAFAAWVENKLEHKVRVIYTPYDISASGAEVENVKLDAITLKEFLKKHEIKDGAGE